MRVLTNALRPRSAAWRSLVLLAGFLFTVLLTPANAQDSVSHVVEVYWQSSRMVSIPGVTQATVLDDSICSAKVLTDQVQFTGLARGETVSFAWVKEQRVTLRLRIIARPEVLPPPRLSQSQLDALGNGVFGSSMQTFVSPEGRADYFFLHQFSWRQQTGKNWLSLRGQIQDSTALGAPWFNANTASIEFSTPKTDVALIDFPLTLNGGIEAKVSPNSTYNVYMVRGADVTLRSGANRYEFFAGSTIPPYYLTLSGTRDTAGFNFNRKESSKLYLYATTGWVNSPLIQPRSNFRRENSFFQTAGLAYRPNLQWGIQGSLGGSTRGGLAEGTVSYSGEKLTAFLSGTASSADFPLNQLQLFFAGGSSVSAGTSLKVNNQIAGSIYFQHSAIRSTAFFAAQGKSDYLNPNLSLAITPREAITLNYTWTRNSSGLTLLGRSRGQRFDVALNSRLGEGISNTAQFTFGALSDPFQLRAQGQFTARESLSFPLRAGYITLGLEHTRNNPSLAKRLNEQIGLLPLYLQQLFLINPLAFVQSANLDPAIRALLQNLQPTNTEISLSGQFRIGDRLNLNPTVSYLRNAEGRGRDSSSRLFGYSLSYQATATLQLISSLSNVYVLDPRQQRVRRSTVLNFGFNKTVVATPRWLLPFHKPRRVIRGRVYRDLNVNGIFNAGEPGLAGVRVDLTSGESTRTDAQGRFEFRDLRPNAYRVSVPLSQFTEAVRVTGPTDVRVELIEEKTAEVSFGIINFARVQGNVFNDSLLTGRRQPDANGLRAIKLMLSGEGVHRQVASDGAGDYEFSEVPPGEYQINLERSTLPPNYVGGAQAAKIHVTATSTIVQDIPVQALRSVSGHVYFKPAPTKNNLPGAGPEGDAKPKPLAGVQLAAGHAVATTDTDGAFVLRNLPAGELTVSLVPARPLPPGLTVPSGRIKLSLEPVQVENATIIISNGDLLPYILPEAPASQ